MKDNSGLADEKLREAIGRAWCHEENVAKEMDADLAEAVLWEIRAALADAAPPAEQAGDVGQAWRVKPLVWRKQSGICEIADTPWGCAAVQDESHALAPKRWGWWMVGSGEDDSPSGYGIDIESAKSAAQADYASRITAALEPDPTPALSWRAMQTAAAEAVSNLDKWRAGK